MESDLSSIVEAGLWAPSADNRHYFRVQGATDGLCVSASEPYFTLPYHRRILCLISFGAVVENMVVRASRHGYRVDVALAPDPSDPALIAELRLVQGAQDADSALDAAIFTRHTNRRLVFSGPRLAEDALVSLRKALLSLDGVSLRFLDAPRERSRLLRLVRIAESERFNTRAMHRDLFSSVRFDVGWRAAADDGLPPGALGVEPGMRWAFSQLRHWPVMNALRHIGFHHALGFRAADLPCRFAPHCGALTTSLPLEAGALTVGRALQRIWLRAESLGLAFQPLAGAALLALPGYTDVPARTRERLQRGWKELTPEIPLIVFRLGRAPRPALRTGRPPIAAYIQQ